MLTAQATVMNSPLSNVNSQVYIKWNHKPHGAPNEHLAMGEDCIISGQATSSLTLIGPIVIANYVAHND